MLFCAFTTKIPEVRPKRNSKLTKKFYSCQLNKIINFSDRYRVKENPFVLKEHLYYSPHSEKMSMKKLSILTDSMLEQHAGGIMRWKEVSSVSGSSRRCPA